MSGTKPLEDYISEVNEIIQSVNSTAVGAFSTFLDEVKNIPGAAELSAAENFAKMADFYDAQFRNYAKAAVQ